MGFRDGQAADHGEVRELRQESGHHLVGAVRLERREMGFLQGRVHLQDARDSLKVAQRAQGSDEVQVDHTHAVVLLQSRWGFRSVTRCGGLGALISACALFLTLSVRSLSRSSRSFCVM